MAFVDPQSVTISGDAVSLPRVNTPENGSLYREADGSHRLLVRHSYGKRVRSNISLMTVEVAPDPFTPAINKENQFTIGFTIDRPVAGFSNADVKAACDGLLAYLTASSGAKLTQMLGGES